MSGIKGTWMLVGPYVRLMLPDQWALIGSLGNHPDAFRAQQKRDGVTARYAIQRDVFESTEELTGAPQGGEDVRAAITRKSVGGYKEASSSTKNAVEG